MVPLYESGGKVMRRRIATVLYLLCLAKAMALGDCRLMTIMGRFRFWRGGWLQ
jgi:hypothetical protein